MTYENLCIEAEQQSVEIYEKPLLPTNKGFYCNGIILLNSRQSSSDKKCILAEEMGHHHTSSGDIADQSILVNRKQERRARVWAHEHLIPLTRIVQAHRDGIRSQHELAEYLDVTEQFLHEAIERYKEKYGKLVLVNDVHLCLEPLGVIELFDFPL